MANLQDEIANNFSPEEIQGLQADIAKRGFTNRGAAEAFLKNRLSMRKQLVREEVGELRESPDFQEAVGERQLPEGSELDLDEEAMSFGQAMKERASPLLGGYGGSVDLQGEYKDAMDAFPGQDVQVIEVPTQTGTKPVIVVQGEDGKYIPVNRPGPSAADAGNMIGDIGTLEGVGSLAMGYGTAKASSLLARMFAVAAAGGTGGAADEFLNDPRSPNIVLRGASGFMAAMLGESAGEVVKGTMNLVGKSTSIAPGSLEYKALERARAAEAAGAEVAAGQVSPATFAGKLRTRWTQLSPALREQVLEQRVGVGQRIEDLVQQYKSSDGVDQALLVGGLDRTVLDDLEREIGSDLQNRAMAELNAVGSQSRAGAGQELKEALFDVTDKERASYRTLGQAKMYELENTMLDAAETPVDFKIDLAQPVRSAKEALAGFPLLQQNPNRIAAELESGRDVLGATIDLAKKKYHADLAFVLQTLDKLPEDFLQNKATYQVRIGQSGVLQSDPVRVDGDGSLRVPYEVKNETGQAVANPGIPGKPTEGPSTGEIIKTYEMSGVETVRMLRGKLRDFFGNELLPANGSEVSLARKMYLQLGEALEGVEGAPEFTTAVRQYNKFGKGFFDRMEMLQNAGFAKQGNGQQLVTSFTQGAMDFSTLNTLKGVLRRSGERGPEAWSAYRNAATRDFLQNPEKIANLDIEPKTASLMYSKDEMKILRNYAGVMDDMTKRGFQPVAARASGERGKALALFSTVNDNDAFSKLWHKLGDKERNLMRFSIIEDLMNKSKSDFAGAEGVWNPDRYATQVQHLMQGDTGVRMEMVFPKETLKELNDVGTIASFYRDVQKTGDVGASIRGQQVVGEAVPTGSELASNPMEAIGTSVSGLLTVKFEQMLASSLAEGTLGKIFKPRLAAPIGAIQKLPAYTAMGATTLNSLQRQAEGDFDKAVREAGEKAKVAEVKARRRGHR